MSVTDRTRVIGYIAINPPHHVLCDGPACIVAGSESAIRHYLNTYAEAPQAKFLVKKARLGEILVGLSQGGRYAFDEKSYHRFYPLANREGFELGEEDFSTPSALEGHFHFVVIGS